MSVLISIHSLSKSFGAKTLFQNLSFGVESGQKIGLIGPNGAGKSTLLKILSGNETPDHGDVRKNRGLRIGFLTQSPKFQKAISCYETILESSPDPNDGMQMALAAEWTARFELDQFADTPVTSLSGGWQKRVALACELIKEPDLLLLDEPTNHLDVESILFLENFLKTQTNLGLITVTHDRLFLEKTSDFIFDLDRRNPDGLLQFKGSYSDFLDHKQAIVEQLQNLEQVKKNTLRRETEWLRRGAKARQTKQKARIERAGDLATEVQDLKQRNFQQKLKVNFGEASRLPKKMLETKNLSQSFDTKIIFDNLNLLLSPGDRIGLLGSNGCGKTTLIKTLIGEIQPKHGSVFISDLVKISYFAQKKESLDPNKSLLKTICPEGDYVQMRGESIFARSYLSRFLFRNDQMDLPVGKLSGGEQSRLLIAQMMLTSESILVLDEPTNDLDIATLDVLQDSLADFAGAVVLVTHDRYFMDQVVNQIYAFHPSQTQLEKFTNYFQYEDWLEERNKAHKLNQSKSNQKKIPAAENSDQANNENNFVQTNSSAADINIDKKKKKLSFKEQRELEQLPSTIEQAEQRSQFLKKELENPELLANYVKLQEVSAELETLEKKIIELYERWTLLSN